jgi:predicted nuclease of restriction endonuclease-like (RecB) superfamily
MFGHAIWTRKYKEENNRMAKKKADATSLEIGFDDKPILLFNEITEMIEQCRRAVYKHANGATALLFWNIGKRVNEDILNSKRAEYGKQVVGSLAAELSARYGRSYELRNLRRMMQFPDLEIVSPLATQLTWSHIIEILPIKTAEARLFYLCEAANNQLGKRGLREMISRKAYERREIANSQLGGESLVPKDTFKDPYLFDVLGLKRDYLEADLEQAIIGELGDFIIEFGKGFTFAAQQKRMIIDGEDFYLDLLMYNRKLRRLVAVELKRGRFKAEYKGQMELYLKWLNRYERQEGENEPIGIILCAEGNREQIELLELDRSGIMVAEYWTELPPKAEFEAKIHTILAEARERQAQRQLLLGGEGSADDD